mmetsp:Transcript_13585/g.23864  ORF Transcript_13585/g.23864 Transcript_13585/m.23864 type:complete len:202 (-) Transcript_13585:494-1099(-)
MNFDTRNINMTQFNVRPASQSMLRSSITLPTTTSHNNNRKRPRDTSSSSSGQTKPLSASITLPIVGTRVLDNIIDRLLPTVDLTTEPSSLSEGGSVTSSSMSSVASTTNTILSSVASTTTATSTIPKRMDNKETISSPQEFFTAMLQDRGYPATMVCSLKCGYHNTPTVSLSRVCVFVPWNPIPHYHTSSIISLPHQSCPP